MKNQIVQTFVLAFGAASGALIFTAIPFLIGAATEVFQNPATVGLAAAVELVSMGVACSLVGAVARVLPERQGAVAGAIVLILANAGSWLALSSAHWEAFLVTRLFAGIGEGLLFSICNASAGRMANADRAFTAVAFAQVALGVAFYSIMLQLSASYNAEIVPLVFVAFAVLAIPGALMIPRREAESDTGAQNKASQKFSLNAWLVLAAFGVYSIALFLKYPFVESIGLRAGFTRTEITSVLGLATMTSILGPLLKSFIGLRFGRFWPTFLAIATQMIGGLILVYSTNLVLWGGAQVFALMMIFVLNPMIFGLAAEVDSSGRTVALTTAIMSLTAASGPIISSVMLYLTGGYASLGWCNAVVYLTVLLLLTRPLLQHDALLTKAKSGATSAAPALRVETP